MTSATKTIQKHTHQCTMAFGKFTKTTGLCPRCDELKSGAPARAGWQKSYYARKRAEEERFSREIKNHNCKTSNCSLVCTFGDW